MRFLLAHAAADHNRAIMVIDISVGFMHARSDENIVVKVPKDIKNTTPFWKLKAAINGARKASQLWKEYCADKLCEMGFQRNDVNPCIFWHPEYDFHFEQHGDDFLGNGLCEHALVLKELFEKAFCCKKVGTVSNHSDDMKVTNSLKREIKVDEHGYHLEMDPRYAESLIHRCGLDSSKGAPTPMPKSCQRTNLASRTSEAALEWHSTWPSTAPTWPSLRRRFSETAQLQEQAASRGSSA